MYKSIWKDIPGYSRYEVNQGGVVRNKTTGLIHKTRHSKHGYIHVDITDDNGDYKCCSVHRLVGMSWLTPPNGNFDDFDINHKNSIRDDNHYENLEWCTRSENIVHAFRNNRVHKTDQFKVCPVKLIDDKTKEELEFYSMSEAARFLNVSPDCISMRFKRKSKSSIKGYRLEKVNS
jgi:hypothetical protein